MHNAGIGLQSGPRPVLRKAMKTLFCLSLCDGKDASAHPWTSASRIYWEPHALRLKPRALCTAAASELRPCEKAV